MNDQNLIILFRNYHKLSIPSYIGTTANSIFHGLLYKFNEMGFPESLKISNKELLHLSGIADIRTFRHARQKLLNYLHNESDTESYLIKMFANNTKEYSIYSINYVILQENYLLINQLLISQRHRVLSSHEYELNNDITKLFSCNCRRRCCRKVNYYQFFQD
jgi:hypothetical protein